MDAYYLAAFTIRNYAPLFPWFRLKMKKHGAAAIHLQVEISLGHIRTRGKEEFDTTVFINIILMCCGGCTNVSVLDSKHNAYSHVIVGDLHLYLGEMLGFLPHVVLEQLGWNVLSTETHPKQYPPSEISRFLLPYRTYVGFF